MKLAWVWGHVRAFLLPFWHNWWRSIHPVWDFWCVIHLHQWAHSFGWQIGTLHSRTSTHVTNQTQVVWNLLLLASDRRRAEVKLIAEHVDHLLALKSISIGQHSRLKPPRSINSSWLLQGCFCIREAGFWRCSHQRINTSCSQSQRVQYLNQNWYWPSSGRE